MSVGEKEFARFLADFPDYQATIEELRPLKRPMLLWSTVSLLYVISGLQLKGNTTASLWGFQIVGLTDTKLTIFFILATLYYTVKWLWTRRVRLRTYKNDGFMQLLWQYCTPRSREKSVASGFFVGLKGNHEQLPKRVVNICWRPLEATEQERPHRGAISELFNLRFSHSAASFVEHIFIPYLGPLIIAAIALIALFVRLCCSV